MPQSDYLSTYRLTGFSPRTYLSVYTGQVVASGTLLLDAQNGATALGVSYSVGSEADVKRGFQVIIRDTATGKRKGETRVRFSGTINANLLPVRELPSGAVQAESGDTFEVRAFVPFDTRLTAADTTFAPDGEAYTDQGSNPDPLMCSGGAWAGRVDAGQTYATIVTNGSNSRTVDPDSASGVAHAWEEQTGVAFQTGSAATDVSPVYEVDQGQYLIAHGGEDIDNGKARTQYVPYIVHDADNPPYDVSSLTYAGDDENGISFGVTVHGTNITYEDIPYGALCILWSDDDFVAHGRQDLHRSAVAGRSHILAIGYARRETQSMDGNTGVERLTLEIQSPLARLAEIAAYSKIFYSAASPDGWSKLKTLTTRRVKEMLWLYYTTGTDAGYDLVFDSSYEDTAYPALSLQRSDPVGQFRELASGRVAKVTMAERGAQFNVHKDLDFVALASRAALLDFTLTDADVYSAEYPVEHQDDVEILELRGITAGASGNQAVYSRAPGLSPGGGKSRVVIERAIPDDQTEASAWASFYLAKQNRTYTDADGIKTRVGELTLRCPGQYDVLDFVGKYVKFNYQGRRTDFDGLLFWLKQVSLEVDPATLGMVTVMVWSAATAAPPGEKYQPPLNDNIVSPITFPQLPPTTYDPLSVFGLGGGTHSLGAIANDGYLYLADTRPSVVVWSRYALSPSGTPIMFIEDAFNPTNGVLITTTHKYRALDLTSTARTLASSSAFAYTSSWRRMQSERGVDGLFVVASHDDDGRVDVDYTTDSGATWNNVPDIGGIWVGGAGDDAAPGCHVFPDGRVLIGAFTGSGSTGIGRLKVAAAGGLPTFSDYDGETTQVFPEDIHVPFQDGSIVYYGGGVASGYYDSRLYKKVGSAARVDVSPYDGSEYYGTTFNPQFSIKTCDADKSTVVLVGRNRTGGTVKHGVWRALNGVTGAASWTELFAPSASQVYRRVWIAGDTPDVCWLSGAGALIQTKNLRSATPVWRDLSGNLASFGSPTFLNIFGVS